VAQRESAVGQLHNLRLRRTQASHSNFCAGHRRARREAPVISWAANLERGTNLIGLTVGYMQLALDIIIGRLILLMFAPLEFVPLAPLLARVIDSPKDDLLPRFLGCKRRARVASWSELVGWPVFSEATTGRSPCPQLGSVSRVIACMTRLNQTRSISATGLGRLMASFTLSLSRRQARPPSGEV